MKDPSSGLNIRQTTNLKAAEIEVSEAIFYFWEFTS